MRNFVFEMIHKNASYMVKILQKSKTAKNVSKTSEIDIIAGKMRSFPNKTSKSARPVRNGKG